MSGIGERSLSGGGEKVAGGEESGVDDEGDLVVLAAEGRPRRSDHRHNRFLGRHFR